MAKRKKRAATFACVPEKASASVKRRSTAKRRTTAKRRATAKRRTAGKRSDKCQTSAGREAATGCYADV